MPFLPPKQQRQSTDRDTKIIPSNSIIFTIWCNFIIILRNMRHIFFFPIYKLKLCGMKILHAPNQKHETNNKLLNAGHAVVVMCVTSDATNSTLRGFTAEVCGLRTRISTDPDLQISCGHERSVDPPNKHICGCGPSADLTTSIVCRTNLERKCQCTSSQQFENWSIFGHCSRLCKKACLTVWGPRPRDYLLDTV